MGEHPIENLMNTAMNSIKDMIDVNTIIGDPIQTSNNTVIIPISKVGFGFAAGGSEFKGEALNEYTKRDKEEAIQYKLPFGGGSGAGVSIVPVAFIVVQANTVKLLPVDHNSCIDRLLDYVPDIIDKVNSMLNKQMQNKKEEKMQDERRRERERKELKETKEAIEEARKSQEAATQTTVKPRKNTKVHKPIESYEFEYDEVENNNPEDNYYSNEDDEY